MTIAGRRIQIAGSARADLEGSVLEAAHAFVRGAVQRLIDAGAGIVAGASGEPLGDESLPLTFDWTILETVARAGDPAPGWSGRRDGRIRVVASEHGIESIPVRRLKTWLACTARSDFELESLPPGWRIGGVIRSRQATLGDVLVVIGGGAGVEHLAEAYQEEGKPVVPIHCDLGATSGDGRGGGSYLHSLALSDVSTFLELAPASGGAAARLSRLRLKADSDIDGAITDLVSLLSDLRAPRAFYVRLLNQESAAFEPVERFFRDIVDPIVIEKGFAPHEVGRNRPEAAFMNVEIFEGLHRAGLVVVDLTDVRPNCMMELGYALGRRRRTVISAMKDTPLPFDQDKLPTYFWEDSGTAAERLSGYRTWMERYFDMPVLVS